MNMSCNILGCSNNIHANKLCNYHYHRKMKNKSMNNKKYICIECKNPHKKRANSLRCNECLRKINNQKTLLRAKRNWPDKLKRLKKAGQILSDNSNIIWQIENPLPDFNYIVTFCIPYDINLSKNVAHRFGRRRVFKNSSTAKLQEDIGWHIKQKGIDKNLIQSKLFIDLLVEKPTMRGDAINFIDTIADAIKSVIDFDDNWFCIGRVDWKINKNNPKIWITLKQDNLHQTKVCETCGRILILNNYTKNKSSKDGKGRICKACTILSRKLL